MAGKNKRCKKLPTKNLPWPGRRLKAGEFECQKKLILGFLLPVKRESRAGG